MKQEASIILLSFFIFIIFFSGITRHDVEEENYLELASHEQFDCVGQVFKDTIILGSCVLISEYYLLSAAHCFIESETKEDTIQYNGMEIVSYVTINERITDPVNLYIKLMGVYVKVKNIILHPNYLDSLNKGTCDLAILELEKPILGILPTKLNNSFDELNSNVVGVGYGASGAANRPDLVSFFNKKIAGENVIDSISGAKYLGLETILMADFDHSTRNDCNKMGSPIPRPLEYIPAGGDSGGGLFRFNNNGWELIGICSGGGVNYEQLMITGYYGQVSNWTRVSVFADWIIEQME